MLYHNKYTNQCDKVTKIKRHKGLCALHYAILNQNIQSVEFLISFEFSCVTQQEIQIKLDTTQEQLQCIPAKCSIVHLASLVQNYDILNIVLNFIKHETNECMLFSENEFYQMAVELFIQHCTDETKCFLFEEYFMNEIVHNFSRKSNNFIYLLIINQKVELLNYLLEQFVMLPNEYQFRLAQQILSSVNEQSILHHIQNNKYISNQTKFQMCCIYQKLTQQCHQLLNQCFKRRVLKSLLLEQQWENTDQQKKCDQITQKEDTEKSIHNKHQNQIFSMQDIKKDGNAENKVFNIENYVFQ